jgi:hypothetical protein
MAIKARAAEVVIGLAGPAFHTVEFYHTWRISAFDFFLTAAYIIT